jgi:uncharacterized membrane protein
MKTIVIAYVFTLLPMLAVDTVWLVTMSKRLYAPRLGSLLAESPRLAAAAIFYLLYALGPAFLVVAPAVDDGAGFLKVALLGALLGLVAYGTYDLTNQATLKKWPTFITVIDLVWGALLTGAVSIISVSITRALV